MYDCVINDKFMDNYMFISVFNSDLMALMDIHIMNGLLAVINGLHVFVGQLLLVVDKYVRMLRTIGFASFERFVLTDDETGVFLCCC